MYSFYLGLDLHLKKTYAVLEASRRWPFLYDLHVERVELVERKETHHRVIPAGDCFAREGSLHPLQSVVKLNGSVYDAGDLIKWSQSAAATSTTSSPVACNIGFCSSGIWRSILVETEVSAYSMRLSGHTRNWSWPYIRLGHGPRTVSDLPGTRARCTSP